MSESPSTESFPQPEYPNSPLQGAVFEIRFRGEPAIECHRDEFFAEVRHEFPIVLVPKLEAGAAPALSPYRFQREDGSAQLMTALHLFAYRTVGYPGFPKFHHEALKWIRAFGKKFGLDRLSRTGLRYTNVVPYVPGEMFPVTNFFDVNVKLGSMEYSQFKRLSISAAIPAPCGGVLTVQIEDMVQEGGPGNAILLDFDFAIEGPDLHLASVEQYLDDSHRETKKLFEGLLTSRYRSFLLGEGLE